MTNADKEKVLKYLDFMQEDIWQIKQLISGSLEVKELPLSPYPTQLPTQIMPKQPIGILVRSRLKYVLEQRQWSEQEFYCFFDEFSSKYVFDINYPLLAYDRYDHNGYSRYYKHPILVNGKKCFLCSQWYEHSDSRKKLLDFLGNYENL